MPHSTTRYIWIIFPALLIIITTVGVVLDANVQRRALVDFAEREQALAQSKAATILDAVADYEGSLETLSDTGVVGDLDDVKLGINLIYKRARHRHIPALVRVYLINKDLESVYAVPEDYPIQGPDLTEPESGPCGSGMSFIEAQRTQRTIISAPFNYAGDVQFTINQPLNLPDIEGVLVGTVSLSTFVERLFDDGQQACRRFLIDEDGGIIDNCEQTPPLVNMLDYFGAEDSAVTELLGLRLQLGLPGLARLSDGGGSENATEKDLVVHYSPLNIGGHRFYLVAVLPWDEVIAPLSQTQRRNWIVFGALVLFTVALGALLWRRQSRRLREEMAGELRQARHERRRSLENLRSINRALTVGGDLEQIIALVSGHIVEALDLLAVQVYTVVGAPPSTEVELSASDYRYTVSPVVYSPRVPAERRVQIDKLEPRFQPVLDYLVDLVHDKRGPVRLDDLESLPDEIRRNAADSVRYLEKLGGCCLIACPLFSRTGFEGLALMLPHRSDLNLNEFETFAGYLAQGIGSTQAEERRRRALAELDESYARLRDFNNIGAEILAENDLVHICRRVVDAITNHSTFQRAVLSLMEDDVLHRFAFSNLSEAEIQQLLSGPPTTRERIEEIQELALTIGKCYYLPAARADGLLVDQSIPSRADPGSFLNWDPNDFFFVPLIGQHGEFLGMISADDPRDGLVPTEFSIQPLESFANLAAQAIATARLRESLRRSREEFRSLFRDASDALFDLDAGWNLLNINRRFVELTGSGHDELKGLRITELVRGESRETLVRALERLDSGLGPQEIEFILEHPVEGERTILLNVERKERFTLFSEAAGVYQGSLRDVTTAKRAEREILRRQEQLKIINKLGRLALSSFDRKTLITQTVDALKDSLDYDNIAVFMVDESGGELILEAISGFYEVLISVGYSLYLDQGIVGWAASTGMTRYVSDVYKESRYVQPVDVFEVGSELSIPLLVEGEAIGVLDIQSNKTAAFDPADISALETVADQLSQALHNISLYQELREKALALALANEELIKLDQMKSDFVSMVSHELNTPVTVIKGYAQLMYNRIIGEVNEKQLDLLRTIVEKSDHLTKLITELLDLLKLESGQYILELEEADISAMLEDFFENQDKFLDTPRMKLVLNLPKEPVILNVDKGKLYTAFVHMLSNANKFTIGEGSVTISVREQEDDYHFTVADTGIGIPESEFEKIFERLYQVDSTLTRHYGGTGLGLAITRAIVVRHRGRIWVESELGVGSRFNFTIPKELTIHEDFWEDIE